MTEYFSIPSVCGITDGHRLTAFPVPAPGIPFSLSGTLTDGMLASLSPLSCLPVSPLTDPANRRSLVRLTQELTAYFAGELRDFTIPTAPCGTPYQKAVWSSLRRIPYGQSRTYGEIALSLGYTAPMAARAVGNACGKNPILLLTPCHRVFAKDSIGGFSGAPELKRWLCRLEKIPIPGE